MWLITINRFAALILMNFYFIEEAKFQLIHYLISVYLYVTFSKTFNNILWTNDVSLGKHC